MRIVALMVALLCADSAALAQTSLELVEVSDTIERPGGGAPLGFSVRAPKGAQPAPKLIEHMRAFGRDVSGGRISISLTRYSDEMRDVDGLIRYKANTYGGLDSKQEVEKGTYLAVLKPQGDLQSVFVFKKAKAGYIEMECNGPPSHAAGLKEACASLKLR
jgi:hypothetical protein